jgi:hypothetical protein
VRRQRRIKITVESSQLLFIRQAGRGIIGYCPACSGPVLSVEEAMTAAGVSSRVLHRLVEADTVHFAEAPEGALLVCLNSLMAAVDNP